MVSMITGTNDAIAKYAGALPLELEHADVVTDQAFVDAGQAEKNL